VWYEPVDVFDVMMSPARMATIPPTTVTQRPYPIDADTSPFEESLTLFAGSFVDGARFKATTRAPMPVTMVER
jgi:hypothetical protein